MGISFFTQFQSGEPMSKYFTNVDFDVIGIDHTVDECDSFKYGVQRIAESVEFTPDPSDEYRTNVKVTLLKKQVLDFYLFLTDYAASHCYSVVIYQFRQLVQPKFD